MKIILTESGICIVAVIPNEDQVDEEGNSLKPEVEVLETEDFPGIGFLIMGAEMERNGCSRNSALKKHSSFILC